MISRRRASIRNAINTFSAQLIKIFGQFLVQTIFIHTLGTQYLGANGLFNNIITFLSFAELGIGSAFAYALYRPLAEDDKETIKAVLNLFRKVYNIIGLVILFFGLGFSYFVPLLIKNNSIVHLRIYFILYLLSTVVSYFFTYNRTLLISDQMGYIDSRNQLYFSVFRYIFQIIFLVFFDSYYGYLIIQVLSNFLANIAITKIAHKRYPFLKESISEQVPRKIIISIRRNIIGTISSKIGYIIVTGTDNILISKFVGLMTVGLYSNYSLVISAITTLLNQVLTSVVASFGNLGATEGENKKKQLVLFDQFVFYNAISTLFIGLVLYGVFQPFINVWLGPKYQLSQLTLALIIINFVLAQFRPALFLVNAYGLFWGYRVKSIVEGIVNFVLSFYLVKYTSMGINGVLLGTIVGNICVNSWWDPLILFSGAFKTSITKFYFKYWLYNGLFIIGLIIEQIVISLYKPNVTSIFSFICYSTIVVFLVLVFLLIALSRTSGERDLFTQIKKRIRIKHRKER